MICKWDNEHKQICFQQVRSDCMYYYNPGNSGTKVHHLEMHVKQMFCMQHELWTLLKVMFDYVKSLQEKYSGIASGVKPQHFRSLQTLQASHWVIFTTNMPTLPAVLSEERVSFSSCSQTGAASSVHLFLLSVNTMLFFLLLWFFYSQLIQHFIFSDELCFTVYSFPLFLLS